MNAIDKPVPVPVTPLLFDKRQPVASAISEQYVGTDTELDIK